MENQQKKKQIIILAAYVVFFAIIAFLLWLIFSPSATCFDHKQNQQEKGVDCGGPCSPCKDLSQSSDLNVKETAVAFGGNNTYDVVAKVSNPNDIVGASSFDYAFTLKDASGNVVATKQGTSFILPADTKYVTELGIQTDNNAVPASAEVKISNPKWTKLDNVEKPQLNIYSKKYSPAPMGVGSEAEGVLRNESSYDLNKITVVIILRDDKGKIIGVNTTQKDTVRAGEERDFKLNWPYTLSGSVRSMEVDAQSNVFDSQNFTTSIYSGSTSNSSNTSKY